MQQLMQRPAIADYLETRDASHEAPLRDAVKNYLGNAIETADVELWDPQGRRLFAAGAALRKSAAARSPNISRWCRRPGTRVIGPAASRGRSTAVSRGRARRSRRRAARLRRRAPANLERVANPVDRLAAERPDRQRGVDRDRQRDGSAWTDLSDTIAGLPITRSATIGCGSINATACRRSTRGRRRLHRRRGSSRSRCRARWCSSRHSGF